jgi:hypothetical protein
MCHRKNYARSSANKSASAVPYNRTIYRTVEKCPTRGSGWRTKSEQTKKTKKLYFNCRGWRGEKRGKKSAVHGKTKFLKLQSHKLTVVQFFLPGL